MNLTTLKGTGLSTAFLLTGVLCSLAKDQTPSLQVERDPATQQVVVYEGNRPVLQYNDQLVSAPEGFTTNEDARKYAVARSDYIHPLYGLDGQVLTHDFSKDHPHHRGIYWAWPEVAWQGKKGDLHALQNVFARPTEPATWRITPDYAEVTGNAHWLWEDKTPIVRETVTIRVWPSGGHGRFIDTILTFEAIDQTVTLGRRGLTAYGGLNIRLAPIGQLKLQPHADGLNPAWSDCSGIWKDSDHPAGLTVFESRRNPDYPGDYIEYPTLPWFQPTFPRSGKAYALEKGQPLTLQYRFWIRRGGPVAGESATQVWHQFQRASNPTDKNTGAQP